MLVLCLCLFLILVVFALWGEKIFGKAKSDTIEFGYNYPFSVAGYLDRIENFLIEINKDREKEKSKEDYQIILWWGLDGLRLNKDGTFTWIKREGEKTNLINDNLITNDFCSIPVVSPLLTYGYQQCCCSYNTYYTNLQLQNCCSIDSRLNLLNSAMQQCTQNKILELQEQNRILTYQIAQNEQNRKVLNSLNYNGFIGS